MAAKLSSFLLFFYFTYIAYGLEPPINGNSAPSLRNASSFTSIVNGHNIFQAAQQFFYFNSLQVWGPQINQGSNAKPAEKAITAVKPPTAIHPDGASSSMVTGTISSSSPSLGGLSSISSTLNGHNIFQASQQSFYFNAPQVWGSQINQGSNAKPTEKPIITTQPTTVTHPDGGSSSTLNGTISTENSTVTTVTTPASTTESNGNSVSTVCTRNPTSKLYLHDASTRMTWNEARKFCRNRNGHLPILRSRWEKEHLLDIMDKKGWSYIWLGIHSLYSSVWVTTTGLNMTEVGYADWIASSTTINMCADLWHDKKMHPQGCTGLSNIICEIPSYN